jgi:hypothetical protein
MANQNLPGNDPRKHGNDFRTAVVAAISTGRSDLLRSFTETIAAGAVLTPKEQRAALRGLCELIDKVAGYEALTREFVHVVEGIKHTEKQAEAAHDKARAFLTKLQGGPCSS